MKFMMWLEDDTFKELKRVAKRRGIGVQEFLRAVVIPEWREHNQRRKPSSSRTTVSKGMGKQGSSKSQVVQ